MIVTTTSSTLVRRCRRMHLVVAFLVVVVTTTTMTTAAATATTAAAAANPQHQHHEEEKRALATAMVMGSFRKEEDASSLALAAASATRMKQNVAEQPQEERRRLDDEEDGDEEQNVVANDDKDKKDDEEEEEDTEEEEKESGDKEIKVEKDTLEEEDTEEEEEKDTEVDKKADDGKEEQDEKEIEDEEAQDEKKENNLVEVQEGEDESEDKKPAFGINQGGDENMGDDEDDEDEDEKPGQHQIKVANDEDDEGEDAVQDNSAEKEDKEDEDEEDINQVDHEDEVNEGISRMVDGSVGPAPGAAKGALLGQKMDPKLKGVIREKLAQEKARPNLPLLRKRLKHAKHLKQLAEQQQHQAPGATNTMEAHKPFTKQYRKRREHVLDLIEKAKGRAVRERVEARWKEMEAKRGRIKVPFRKIVQGQRLMERLPVVKRLAKMLHEEELMLDTSLSLFHSLKHDIYQGIPGPLPAQKRRALLDWLELLSATLPEEWGIRDTIDGLLENINFISKGEKFFLNYLNRHEVARKQWSRSCTQHSPSYLGYTCGFWKLLHVMTIGLAQHRGGQTLIVSGMRKPDDRTFSPSEAADVVRDYMQEFYRCKECGRRFVEDYNDCSKYRRCDRLAKDTRTSSDADWKEPAIWLWEVHNDVNTRLVDERLQRKRAGGRLPPGHESMATTHISALWPSLEECVACFKDDGSWNENAVFLYLELDYWPQDDSTKMARLLQFDEDMTEDAVQFKLFWVLLVIGAVLAYFFQVNKNDLQTTILNVRRVQQSVARGELIMDKATAQKRSE